MRLQAMAPATPKPGFSREAVTLRFSLKDRRLAVRSAGPFPFPLIPERGTVVSATIATQVTNMATGITTITDITTTTGGTDTAGMKAHRLSESIRDASRDNRICSDAA
jgi:hypothetical protein